nr:increased DNA methylation 2 isoform X1 [Ipomoea batatas]
MLKNLMEVAAVAEATLSEPYRDGAAVHKEFGQQAYPWIDASTSSFKSSLGTMSTKKSKMSVLVMAAAMSFFWSVLLLFSSVWFHARNVNSRINISHARAKTTGASADIILTSSSAFIIFLILANGKLWFLKSETCSISWLGESPKEAKRKPLHERLGPVTIIKKHTKSPLVIEPSKEIKSAVPSRMRREADVNVLCGKVLKARPKIIVHTSVQEENEESMKSSCATYQNGQDVEAPKSWRVIT